ncbi:MAG: 30S ribosomal protein S8e [Candidatus Aenigmarchaeota archaeon]|nr:30S ribosomal protein S8e [Candidatus Aenigmarchaeota archaeon]
MATWHGESGRKNTGGKINLARKKRRYELGGYPTYSKIGEEKRIIMSTKGGGKKVRLHSLSFVNLTDTKTHKTIKVKIIDVISNFANPDLARRKVITKGAIVNTEAGRARIVSRPGQDGVANAIKIE